MTALSPMRSGRITGSRIGAILGKNKYSKPADVMREMVRQHFGDPSEFEGNEATEHGNAHEEDARTAYEQDRGVLVVDAQEFIVHPAFDWLGVSPDGLVGDDGMAEFKAPYRAAYTSVAEKPEYEAQIQAQLACTGRAWCDFVIWRSFTQADQLGVEPLIIERVVADPDWLPSNLATLAAFHAEFLEIIADPAKAAPYRADAAPQERSDEQWAEASARYLELDAQVKAVTAERDQVRDDLVSLAGSESARGCGVQVIRAERAGSVDYAKAVKKHLPDLDLDEFRKAPSVVFTVKEAK